MKQGKPMRVEVTMADAKEVTDLVDAATAEIRRLRAEVGRLRGWLRLALRKSHTPGEEPWTCAVKALAGDPAPKGRKP